MTIGADGYVGADNSGEEVKGRFGIQERDAEGQLVRDFVKKKKKKR